MTSPWDRPPEAPQPVDQRADRLGPPPLPIPATSAESWGSPIPPARQGGSGSPGPTRTALTVGLLGGLIGAVLGGGVIGAVDHHGATRVVAAPVENTTITRSAPVSASTPASPGSVPAIAAAVLPSVVTIEAKTGSGSATGSGVVLNGSGFILTNNHVVADVAAAGSGGSLQVIPDGGSSADGLAATVVGTDPLSDLAVIRTTPNAALKPAVLGHSSSLRIGDTVLAVGAPLGLDGTVTEGIVSATNRFFTVGGDNCNAGTAYAGAIQTDAAINPGNSGGALVDSTGAVVGINSAIATAPDSSSTSEGGNIGVGFAIPIDEAAPTAQDIIATGHASHPFLGVSTVDSGSPVGAKVTTSQDPCNGGSVPGVQPGSPAAKGGLKDGDVITAIGGKPIQGSDDLVTQIRLLRVGNKVAVTYRRAGASHSVTVTLVERPSN